MYILVRLYYLQRSCLLNMEKDICMATKMRIVTNLGMRRIDERDTIQY